MANEALCKVLCHNLCCLIQATYELGVEARFWGDRDKEEDRVPVESTELVDALEWI